MKNNKSAASTRPATLKWYELIIAYIYGFYNLVKDFFKTEKGKTITLGVISGSAAFIVFELVYQITTKIYLYIIWR